MKRLKGILTITFSDGWKEECIIKERDAKKFGERLEEAIKMILNEGPQGHVKINYRGAFAAGIYDMLQKQERERNERKQVNEPIP